MGLSGACGREGGNGRQALKKSEKVEREAEGRPDASFRSIPSPTKRTSAKKTRRKCKLRRAQHDCGSSLWKPGPGAWIT
jgi:hypothetical protein